MLGKGVLVPVHTGSLHSELSSNLVGVFASVHRETVCVVRGLGCAVRQNIPANSQRRVRLPSGLPERVTWSRRDYVSLSSRSMRMGIGTRFSSIP